MTFIVAGLLLGLWITGRPISNDAAIIAIAIVLSGDLIAQRVRSLKGTS